MRDLILDFKRGGASVPEVVHGIVRIWGTEVRPNGPSVVVTTETTLKLSNGKATLANAQTSGTGPLYEWAYIIQVEPFCGRNYRFYVAIPDGTGPVNLVDLPKLNPITGEGFYLDIEEWEALYGALPSRVDAVEAKNTSQDGKITTLEARPSGNASMRVDTTVGKRVFITDGVTERMISGDTGWRRVDLANGWTGDAYMRRVGETVDIRVERLASTTATSTDVLVFPQGFNPGGVATVPRLRGFFMAGSGSSVVSRRFYVQYNTLTFDSPLGDATQFFGSMIGTTLSVWPTTNPGTPL